ncbi:MAG TPA: hypothetical protein VGF88_01595 [Acidobacteriaceae bacterium]|jgi:hypothetical protein
MKQTLLWMLVLAVLIPASGTATGTCTTSCSIAGFAAKNHRTFGPHPTPTAGSCKIGKKNGYPMPDSKCTPGAINPTVTVAVLNNAKFRTCCVRDKVESETAKKVAYGWYGLTAPTNNVGQSMTCELDHLVPLELGGGDSMDNIWPQCGPNAVTLNNRYFKGKDLVEMYLAGQVKSGQMDLSKTQHGIATDYTQFMDAAKQYCATQSCAQYGGGPLPNLFASPRPPTATGYPLPAPLRYTHPLDRAVWRNPITIRLSK